MTKQIRYEKNDRVYEIKPQKLNMRKWILYLMLPAIILLIISLIGCIYSFSYKQKDVISYAQIGDIDYKVYLKDNDYYEEKYLKKGMQYIANLINTINVVFNYKMTSSEEMDYKYNYKIIANLKITDKNDKSKILYQKEEEIKENQEFTTLDKNLIINENIDIDYGKYNKYVTDFRKDYGLTSYAELDLKMVILVEGANDLTNEKISENNTLEITIPLSEQTINIEMMAKELNKTGSLKSSFDKKINNIWLFLISVVIGLNGMILLLIAIYIYIVRYSMNPYARELNKILKEYDTFIVNAKGSMIEDENKLVRVNNFSELLDAQQIENKPILFYEVERGNKAYFVVIGEKSIYRFTLSRAYQNKKILNEKSLKTEKK